MIECDDGEPAEITRFLEASHGIVVKNLNGIGETDYRWDGVDGVTHLERESIRNIVNGQEEIEEKLRTKLQKFKGDKFIFMPEGVIEPAPNGVLVYRRQQGRNVMLGGLEGRRPHLFKRITNWLYQVGKYCEVYWSSSMASSAVMIGAFYDADQDSDHSTFQRQLKVINWNPNPQVTRLLGMTLNDTNMGVDKCEKVIAKFGTVWNALRANPKEWSTISGISEATAREFMRKNGRLEV